MPTISSTRLTFTDYRNLNQFKSSIFPDIASNNFIRENICTLHSSSRTYRLRKKRENIFEEFLIKLERLERNKQLPVIDCKIKFQANGMITSSNTRFPESMLQGTRTRGRRGGLVNCTNIHSSM